MFAVSAEKIELSPVFMKFQEWWIYDLKKIHPFWKNKIQSQKKIFIGQNEWEALLKAESIHNFSPIGRLKSFSEKYYQYYQPQMSFKEIDKVFMHFHRVGLKKLASLRKIPLLQFQKRFGKIWADFFKAVLNPYQAKWIWKPYEEEIFLEEKIEPDEAFVQASQILEECQKVLKVWADQNEDFCFKQIDIHLVAFDSEEDKDLRLLFPYEPHLRVNLNWVRRVLEERLSQLRFFSPITFVQLRLSPVFIKRFVQLSLFNPAHSVKKSWKEACQKLETQGFKLFQPKSMPSYLPEKSWKKVSPLEENPSFSPNIFYRPLIQFKPKAISSPKGSIFFTEKLQWIEEDGQVCFRNYYITYQSKQWLWIFQDKNKKWFQQGIVE